jgi:hypothetical protein
MPDKNQTVKTQISGTGLTVCTIRLEGRSAVGLAFCSVSDQFSKQKGREKARTRALQALKGK